ncbi:SGNH/GDSL hydrolase family protein [Streptomyces sp. NBC_01190]|uniref:SGNH/GDSL hydrolase family protein n=1 Tax=Streptomyces sp. NBC_01190 TaxID=2903767 RepID=UPI003867E4E4|nr:SGNH/GDSL hydrolase family protein [Streptomyces sp. NBC_01190]
MTRARLVRGGSILAVLVTIAAAVAVTLTLTSGSAAGGHRGSAGAVPRPYTVRVMPLGDSITWGEGSPTASGYRRPLWDLVAGQSRYAVRFVGSLSNGDLPQPANEGHRGWRIGDVSAKVDGWLAVSRPDVVLLHLGINDLLRDTDVAHAPDRLAALIDRIYADRPGVSVVYMGLLPNTARVRTEVAAFDRRAVALARTERQRGRPFWYVTPPTLTTAEMHDGVHPNDAGYRRIAGALFPALGRAVADRIDRRLPPAPTPTPPPAPRTAATAG